MAHLQNEGDVTGYELPKLIETLGQRGFKTDAVSYKKTITVQQGRKKRSVEADAVVFDRANGTVPLVVIETKPPEPFKRDDAAQAISYARLLDSVAPFAVLTNGLEIRAYDTLSKKQVDWETVTGQAARGRVTQLHRLNGMAEQARHEIFKVENVQEYKRILRACHNAIRNNEGYDPTKAFDELSKVMFTKLYEEKHHGDRFNLKKFDEMMSDDINIVQSIFEQTKADPDFASLFAEDAPIELKDRTIRQLVSQFENYDLSLTDFDIKGEAFEHFLGDTFTGGLGQYFTPRNVVNFMIDVSDPKIGEKVVDPFCGTGGFLIAWHTAISALIDELPVAEAEKKERRETLDTDSIFGIDWNERTAQACRMNLSMHGDGDSSDNIFRQSGFEDASIHAMKGRKVITELRVGEGRFDKCLTNPPFGAMETDVAILNAHDLGRGRKSIERAALAMERAIRLTRSEGLVGIIVMDGVLANPSMKFVRDWVRRHAVIEALISLNPETFEGYGGRANTSILFLRKRKSPLAEVPQTGEAAFMAMCLNSGYAANGREIEGNDLIEILEAYGSWKRGEPITSELAWSEPVRERLDPPHYWRPSTDLTTREGLQTQLGHTAAQLSYLAGEAQAIQDKVDRLDEHGESEFKTVPLCDLLNEVGWKEHHVALVDNTLYPVVGVRWWGGGAFVREERRGSEIKSRYLMPVVPKALIYNRMFAYRAAFAIVGDAVDGGYVSNEFPMFTPKETDYDDDVLLSYLVHLLNSPSSLAEIDAESQGSTKTSRNRLVQEAFLRMNVDIPTDPRRMAEVVSLLDSADRLRDELKRIGEAAQAVRDAFGGVLAPRGCR